MSDLQHIRIATRESALAMWQAEHVQQLINQHYPHIKTSLVAMTTKGDRELDTSLAKIGGKGLFVKELEYALLENRADIAVHSVKDLPMEFPAELMLTATCTRADPRDAFVSNHYDSLAHLPQHAIVGTSSLRRQCQIKATRPDLQIKFLRGNVQTRLNKLNAGDYHAIILATAGLERLNLTHVLRERLEPELMLPAVGQGAIGIECRRADHELQKLLNVINDVQTEQQIIAERQVNHVLGGSCHLPLAAFATYEKNELWLRALVGAADGSKIIFAEQRSNPQQAQELGATVANQLLEKGARAILQEASHGN